jgi:hypothetical protein
MTFKIKDLMISELPTGADASEAHLLCAYFQVSCLNHTKIVDRGCKFAGTPPGAAAGPHLEVEHFAQFVNRWSLFCCLFATCGPCSNYIGNSLVPLVLQNPNADAAPASLSALKEELKRQLAQIEQQEAAAEEALSPKTVEEVDMLTKTLNDALGDLRIRRAELSEKVRTPWCDWRPYQVWESIRRNRS